MSMPLKEWLIKKLSLKLLIPERVIDAVISDQFVSAYRATTTHNSIELSGFGKFVFSQHKAKKQMEKYEHQILIFNNILKDGIREAEHKRVQVMLNGVLKNVEHLKPKIR